MSKQGTRLNEEIEGRSCKTKPHGEDLVETMVFVADLRTTVGK